MADKAHENLAEEAAAYLRERIGAVGGYNGIQPEIKRQAACLIEWAARRSVLLADFSRDDFQKLGLETLEHDVYLRPSDRRVIKCTKPGKFGLGHGANGQYGRHCAATPLFYLERLFLMEQEFPTDLRLESIVSRATDYRNTKDASVYVVTSQRLIEARNKSCPHPSEPSIANFMVKLGFRLLENSRYNWVRDSDGIVVTDTKMLNFIDSVEGIVPIDVIVGRREP